MADLSPLGLQNGRSDPEGEERTLVLWVALVGALCILASGVWRYIEIRWLQLVLEFLRDLGIALIIAAALALVVDRYLKAALVSSIATRVSSHVAQNTSKYLFGYLVPPDLKEELLAIMRPTVLRRNFKLKIQIEYLPEHDHDFVRVTSTIKFTLENLKDEVTSFNHSLSMSNMFPEIEPPAIVRLACRARSSGIYEYDYRGFDSLLSDGDKRLALNRSDDERELSVRRLFSAPPFSKDFEFQTVSTEIMKVPYGDQFCFANATSGVEIEISCPKDIDVLVEMEKGREVRIDKDPPERPRNWRYEGVCLAGQHITYRFRRMAPDVSTKPSNHPATNQ
jgi:hypothetical protein